MSPFQTNRKVKENHLSREVYQHFSREHIEEHLIPTVSLIGPSKFLWIPMDPYKKIIPYTTNNVYIYIYPYLKMGPPPSFDRRKLVFSHRASGGHVRHLEVHHEVMRFIRKTIILLDGGMDGGHQWRMGVEPPP